MESKGIDESLELSYAPRMTQPTLRPYQWLARRDVERQWAQGKRAVLLQAPTGAGKTVTGMSMVDRALSEGRRVWWLAHLDVLLTQATRAAGRYGHEASIWRASDRRYRPEARLQVASMQTVIRRLARVPEDCKPDLIVVDEAHRSAAESYRAILAACPRARVLGLTATPWRTDGRGLGEVYESLVLCSVDMDTLIQGGYLVPVRALAAKLPTSVKGLRKVGGEFNAKETEARVMPGIGDVVRGIKEALSQGHGPAIAFCATVKHSLALRDALRDAGASAEHVDAESDADAREALLSDDGTVARGETQVVCCVGVLDEGVDCPIVGTVVLASPTASSGRFIQRVGRGMRPRAGKASLLVLDYGDNIRRHWWPTDDVRPHCTLEGGMVRVEEKAEPAPRQCEACFAVWPARLGPVCPECGWRKEPEKPVHLGDRGFQLGEVQRSSAESWSAKEAAWALILEQQRQRGYKLTWAAIKFSERFKHWPPKAWLTRAEEYVEAG